MMYKDESLKMQMLVMHNETAIAYGLISTSPGFNLEDFQESEGLWRLSRGCRAHLQDGGREGHHLFSSLYCSCGDYW